MSTSNVCHAITSAAKVNGALSTRIKVTRDERSRGVCYSIYCKATRRARWLRFAERETNTFFFHAPLAYMERTGSFAGPVLVPGRPEDCCLADAIRRLLCCLLCIPSQRSGVETEAKPFQCARLPEQK